MYWTGFVMTLRPGGYPGYKEAHDNPWPELVELMEKHKVDMVIYRDGDRLIVHATAPSEADFEATQEGPDCDRWHDFMKEYLETDSDGNIRCEPLELAYVFGKYA